VINLALSEKRILLTEDKDFGRLIYAHGHKAIGVIFLRYPVSERHRISQDLVELIKQQSEKLVGCFVTITLQRIRISRLPEDRLILSASSPPKKTNPTKYFIGSSPDYWEPNS